MKKTLQACLQEGAAEIGVVLSDLQIDQFLIYLRELQKWNAKINLTGIQDACMIIQHHFIDSLSCILSGELEGFLRVVDVGTGAGFPGLPLKIYNPGLMMMLLDASHKKIAFVKNVCRKLGFLDVRCLAKQVEELGGEDREADLIVSRAVGSLVDLISLYGSVFIPPFKLLLQRGPAGKREVSEGLSQTQKAGFEVTKLIPVKLSFLNYQRYLVVLQKLGE